MEFCSVCGSRLKRVENGYWCSKCHKTIECKIASPSEVEMVSHAKRDEEPVFVVNDSVEQFAKINQMCPKCGSKETYHWFLETLGEHAGVRQERALEYFRCVKCSHTWNRGV